MIASKMLAQMLDDSRLDEVKTAIVAKLKTLMPDVTVEAHPGKLDFSDVVRKSVVNAPGVAVGWTRIRATRDVGGTYQTPIQWAAYIVAEDKALISEKRVIPRDAVAHAIGSFLLEILHDADETVWGLTAITHPELDPAPEMKPIFTAKSYGQGTCYYAVTWTQSIVGQGVHLFDGPTPEIDEDGQRLVFPEGEDLPLEIAALVGNADEELP